MKAKRILLVLMLLALLLSLSGCGAKKEVFTIEAEYECDITFRAEITAPEGMKACGQDKSKVTFAPEDESFYVVYTVETGSGRMTDQLDATCDRADKNEVPYQRETKQVTVNDLEFICEVLLLQPESGHIQAFRGASAPVGIRNGAHATSHFCVEMQILNGSPGDGFEDSGLTVDDMLPYLEAISIG